MIKYIICNTQEEFKEYCKKNGRTSRTLKRITDIEELQTIPLLEIDIDGAYKRNKTYALYRYMLLKYKKWIKDNK